jgi:hypothetical protein
MPPAIMNFPTMLAVMSVPPSLCPAAYAKPGVPARGDKITQTTPQTVASAPPAEQRGHQTTAAYTVSRASTGATDDHLCPVAKGSFGRL